MLKTAAHAPRGRLPVFISLVHATRGRDDRGVLAGSSRYAPGGGRRNGKPVSAKCKYCSKARRKQSKNEQSSASGLFSVRVRVAHVTVDGKFVHPSLGVGPGPMMKFPGLGTKLTRDTPAAAPANPISNSTVGLPSGKASTAFQRLPSIPRQVGDASDSASSTFWSKTIVPTLVPVSKFAEIGCGPLGCSSPEVPKVGR